MRVAIIGAGAMGAGIGGRITRGGGSVLTMLDGRSEASRQRAEAAGMIATDVAALAQCDLILSIVPPAQSAAVVEQLMPLLADNPEIPFCDANALAPASKRILAQQVEATGGRFTDGSIIGHPPGTDGPGPRLYVSGGDAQAFTALGQCGIDVRPMPGGVGEASALKMCYAALNKGLTALTTAALLVGQKSGMADALMAELGLSQTVLLDRARRAVPEMYPKAWRWVAEMEEIADFLEADAADPSGALIWRGMARFFADRADAEADGSEQAVLDLLKARGGAAAL
ncbi:MAG: DUF1932 domain-containing protein [Croceibacterium sp.]